MEEDSKVNVRTERFVTISSGIYKTEKNFHWRFGDINLPPYKRKSWLTPKISTAINLDSILTFLSVQGNNATDGIDSILNYEISYKDLASLTHKDLELMGLKHSGHRQELLDYFALLPNQDPSFESLCKEYQAKYYNRSILNSASTHLGVMRSALAATTYKLRLMPPDDIILGEKNYASTFVLQTLKELKCAADEIDQELAELEKRVNNDKQMENSKTSTETKSINSKMLRSSSWILMSSVVIAALWYWKLK